MVKILKRKTKGSKQDKTIKNTKRTPKIKRDNKDNYKKGTKSKIMRISSGIHGLNQLIQGGFKKNSINLVAGGAGSGKTILAIQFLVEGTKRGEPGIYITFEEKKDKLFEDMSTFGWDLEKYEKEKKIFFLEYTPEQVKNVLIEGGGEIENLIEKGKVKRLVIDSISSFALLYEDELTKKEASLELFKLIEKWDCTAVLTSQTEMREHGHLIGALEFESDSIILLYYIHMEGKRNRGLEILKMRGTKHPLLTYVFDITDKGMSISKKILKG